MQKIELENCCFFLVLYIAFIHGAIFWLIEYGFRMIQPQFSYVFQEVNKITRVNSLVSLTFEVALDHLPTSLCHQECRWNISDRRCICRKEDQFPLDHYYIGAVCAFLLCKFDVRRPIYSVYPSFGISCSVNFGKCFFFICTFNFFRNYTCMQWPIVSHPISVSKDRGKTSFEFFFFSIRVFQVSSFSQ